MNKKQQQDLIALGIAIVGVIYVLQSYVIAPMNSNIKKEAGQLDQLTAEIRTLKAQSFELPRIKKSLEYLKLEVEELEKYLPKERELPGLLRSISRIASNFQVKVVNISAASASEQQKYTEHVFNISAQGNYHSIARFLNEISQSGRIISARNLVFSSILSAPPSTGERVGNTVNVTFQLVAYTYKG
ncbi:MAG: type 4a pilus biogenesis protein PilO [Endomicrobiia bacterium]|nr:type 4a pilus biogenesis protein PilO [Endomicrobiia bacterium]